MKRFYYLLATLTVMSMAFTGCDNDDPVPPADNTPVAVTGVTLQSTLTLTEGDYQTLTATVLPEDAADKTVTWSSDNDAVATVNAEGLVTAVAAGAAKITVTTTDGNFPATCTVTVEAAPVAVQSISLDVIEATLSHIETLQLTATVLPEDATNPAVEWSCEHEEIATVDENGLVTPVSGADGTTTIIVTATDGSGKTATCEVTVSALGKVTFKTETTWPISGNGITQEWSDVVMASGAKKDTYDGGSASAGYKADFRQNPGYGDLFSFAAVKKHQSQLCPGDWRVPVEQNYINLDKAFGGAGNPMQMTATIVEKYISDWGGIRNGGYCNGDGSLQQTTTMSYYWNLTEVNADNSRCVSIMNNPPFANLQNTLSNERGAAVRCVR